MRALMSSFLSPLSATQPQKWLTIITTITRQYQTFSISLLDKKPISTNQFNQILSHTITTNLFTNPFISSKLLLTLSSLSSSNLSFLHSIFSQIKNPNLHAWNFMFKAYTNSSFPQVSILLYNQMIQNGKTYPDNFTFPFVLKACGRLLNLQKGMEIHSFSLKLGFQYDAFVQNSLILMYSLCGCIGYARRVFDFIPVSVRDVVSWNSMITGYVNMGLCGSALEMFGSMMMMIDKTKSSVVWPSEVTLASVVTACARDGDVCIGRMIHCYVIECGVVLDVVLGSALIDMYAKCGRVDDARKVFDQMHDRNVVCWTSMIAGYTQSGLFKEAMGLFREMLVAGVNVGEATVACVVSACGHLGALEQGRWVHTYCDRNGIKMDLIGSSALIDMYSKCGDIDKAFEIFVRLVQKDVFSWTVMISGFAMNGKSDKALDLFTQMENSSDEVTPNEVTFLGVLSACSHAGLVDKGYHYFNSMTKTYNLTPRLEHYGCMIDLLGRANRFQEAKKFLRAMPIKPDAVIWRSLLFSLLANGNGNGNENIDLVEFAANRIMELEPEKCGGHVLLSNAYAAASRWEDVKRVRKGMDARGVSKKPGCSFVEINGVVHEFFVADSSHPRSDMIYETISGLSHVLRFAGSYTPDIFDYLENVEEVR